MRVAITGGIGSGKSYVCQRLARYGIKVYDCDAAAKRLMRSFASLRQALKALVGEGVYEGDVLQKQVLATFLLASEGNKQRVNDVVHPAVARDFEQSGYEWLESAILFDSGFDRRIHFDAVVCVTAPLELRIQRVMARDGISREKTLEWIQRQLPQEEVLRRSGHEIVNDGSHDIDIQIKNLIYNIQKTLQKMETILSIAGKPGLYRLLLKGKQNLIVETLDEKKRRMPTFANDRIISLADISMYTDAEDVPLWKVLKSLGEKEGSKPCSLNYKKASGKELREFFAEVLPDYDRERVHDNDIKKLIQWYDILVNNGITDFEKTLAPTEGDNVEDRTDA
ncbi:MAG: dephospho-CoA kinase [Prevotella sp.]|nr:dephospho-CoA kinase [Prevotella sp.]